MKIFFPRADKFETNHYFCERNEKSESYDEDIFLLHYEEVPRTVGTCTDGARHCPRSSNNLLYPSYGTCGKGYG